MDNTAEPRAPLPLAGIRVLDFTHAAAGPFATMLLADLGADVIKVEKPGRGDGARYMGEPMLGPLESDYYVALNRNKRDVLIDLQDDRGRQLALDLAAQCDVVVQNFRPGVMDRLGLGFADVSTQRPGIVYCSISAFGPAGPMSGRPANDIIMQSMSGLMGVTGEVGGGPVRIGAPVSDYGSGLFGLIGVLAALHARDDHPEGQHVQVSMLDSSIALMANYIPAVVTLGKRIPRLGRGHAQIVPYQAFECADGSYVMVGAFTNGFWVRLCSAVGRAEWAQDDRFRSNAGRLRHRDLLLTELAEIFLTRTRDDWQAVLDDADVPNSPVLELNEALESPQVAFNETVQDVGTSEQPCATVRCPVRSPSWPYRDALPPPAMGAHSADVLTELLGLTPDAIEDLFATGAAAGAAREVVR
ncbi:MAG TPA: CoA transferase [Trebonia sp.]|jgi:crotonobetainyl-CoA:carnitine CoA-transferase CaiB-like acyl-CoA transferase|nr:CoA transferase [Trebonia sp.]